MKIDTDRSAIVFAILAIAATSALWVLPVIVFPSPGANDAPVLWTLPMPIVALTIAASVVAVARDRSKGRPVTRSIALATYLVGVAVAFVAGLIAGVANLQDDRFWPFLLSPVVFGIAAVGLIVFAVAGRRVTKDEVASGAVIGALAALFLLAWILARGSRDWLLAPYGFDVCLLIALESAVVFVAGSRASRHAMIG